MAEVAFATGQLFAEGTKYIDTVCYRRLRRGAELHVAQGGRTVSSVAGLPPVLKQGSFYIPADNSVVTTESGTLQLVIGVNIPTRLYLLWPALQEVPSWCSHEFDLVRGAEVKVRWSDFTRQQRFYLNVTNQRRLYHDQVLLVFRLRGNHGCLQPGEELELPYTSQRSEAATEQPYFSHVMCLRPAKDAAASPAGSAGGSGAGQLSDAARALSSYSLAEVCTALEDGIFDPAELDRSNADDLLGDAIAAGDDELLFMLVDGGIGVSCSQPSLQLLLQYAQYEDLPQLALAALQQSEAEMTQAVLSWFVSGVRYKSVQEAEQVLTSYCINRRNPLSSIAAVEFSLHKGARSCTSCMNPGYNLGELSLKFKAAKLALLDQLFERYSSEYVTMQQMQLSHSGLPASHRQLMQEYTTSCNSQIPPLLQLSPLLLAAQHCLWKTSFYMLGRGGSSGPVSIHDISPYSLAIDMEDTDFLQHPVVAQYTRRVWRGAELHRMALEWQRAATQGGSHADMASTGPLGVNTRKCGRRRTAGDLIALRSTPKPPAAAGVAAGRASGVSLEQWAGHWDTRNRQVVAGVATALPGVLNTSASGAAEPAQMSPQSVQQANALAQRPIQQLQDAQADELQLSDATGRESPVLSVRLSTSPNAGPVAEEVEDNGHKASSSKAVPAVRRRTTQDWNSVSSDIQGDAKAAWEGAVWLDPNVGTELLQNLGLAGGIGQPLAWAALRLLHGILLTPRAVHNTARLRWVKRCTGETIFLIAYMGQVLDLLRSDIAIFTMAMFVAGNFVNMAFEVRWLNGGSFKRYIRSNWAKLDVVMNFGLFFTLFYEYQYYSKGNKGSLGIAYEGYGVHLEHAVPSVFATLGVFTPASKRMGALLYTLKRAAAEAAVMLPMIFVLIFGCASTLYVVYHKIYPEYATIIGAIRMMAAVTLGGHHLMLEFEGRESRHDPFLVSWGQVVIIAYGVIFNIIIMTLLVAVITKTYNPQSMKAKATLLEAEAVGHYDWRIRHGLAVSPINLIEVAVCWLPQGYRSRVPPNKYIKFGIPPLDGYVPEAIVAVPAMLLPTGPTEFGYLAFLLMPCPVISAIVIVLLVLHLPFGVWHYASKGHFLWANHSGHREVVGEAKIWNNPVCAEAAAGVADQVLKPVMPEQLAAWKAGSCVSLTCEKRTQLPELESSSSLTARRKHQHQQVWRSTEGNSAAVDPRADSNDMKQPSDPHGSRGSKPSSQKAKAPMATLTALLQVLAAVLTGLLVHVLLILVVALSVVVALVSRVLFCGYCIFSPWAADCKCCMRPTRYADYWSQLDLAAALKSAELSGGLSRAPSHLFDTTMSPHSNRVSQSASMSTLSRML